MTETEARSTAKKLRSALIGVTADSTTDPAADSAQWGVRTWYNGGRLHTTPDTMPREWQNVLKETA